MVLLLDQKYSGADSQHKSNQGRLVEIADADLNMADYSQDAYKAVKLIFNVKEGSPVQYEPGDCFLELGLKGTF